MRGKFSGTICSTMRRFLLPLLVLPFFCVACLPPKALPSDEVLQRTALASQKIDSLAFVISMSGAFMGTISNDHMGGHALLKGVLHDHGNALETSLTGSLTGAMSGSPAAMSLSGRLVAFNQKEMYVRLDTFHLTPSRPDVPMAYIEPLLGMWWHIEGNAQSGTMLSTPDPTFLKAQTEAITVTEDHGLEKVDGRYQYHYSVALDRAKFTELLHGQDDASMNDAATLQATGEVWIDAEQFVLTHAAWKVENLPTDDGVLNAMVDITLSDHNKADPVHVPTTSKQLNPALLAPLLHPDDSIPLMEDPEESSSSSSTP